MNLYNQIIINQIIKPDNISFNFNKRHPHYTLKDIVEVLQFTNFEYLRVKNC